MHSQELEAVHPTAVPLCPSEVYHHLFSIGRIRSIIGVLASELQLPHFLSVGCLIVVGDESHNCRFVSKLDKVIALMFGKAVQGVQ